MWWVVALAGAAALILVGIALATEGRWFGGVMRPVYDLVGPTLFDHTAEEDRWRTLAVRIPIGVDDDVLDVGTATGGLPLALAAARSRGASGQLVGVDWSSRMIDRARTAARDRGLAERIRFVVADLRAGIPLEESFDRVVCLGLLETLRDPASLVRELDRALRPSGVLVLSVYRRGGITLERYRSMLSPLGYDS
jgi:SAM-dependent methyltransferase